MLSASALDGVRAAMTASLPGTASVLRDTLTNDDQGGQTATTRTTATYACRLIRATPDPSEREEGGEPVAVLYRKALLPWNADVTPTDRLSVGGAVYEVLGTDADCPERTCLEVRLRRSQ